MAVSQQTVIVPVDGASNIKLEVLDFATLSPVYSYVERTPLTELDGLKYNDTAGQFEWYDKVIAALPPELRVSARVIAPAARGASGGLVGRDNSLCEVPGRGMTLAYTQPYPQEVEKTFRELAGSEEEFFRRTGSILEYPGSLTLLKRLLFEQMQRPGLLERAAGFAVYGNLMAGHFLGPDYTIALHQAGNEHSYWMCHTGAREIIAQPGTRSYVAEKIKAFRELVPDTPAAAYRPLGTVPRTQADMLGLGADVLVVPGGHDTCLSHLPVISASRRLKLTPPGGAVIHLEAGSWTMVSLLGGEVALPQDGYRRGIVVQGTLDGEPVVSSMYGGGRDFSYLLALLAERGLKATGTGDEGLLAELLESDCFALPNINPENHDTGPFPEVNGGITRPGMFYRDGETGRMVAELSVAITAAFQIGLIGGGREVSVVLTGGGSRDETFGRLAASLCDREVYVLYDGKGNPLSETTTLGAAMNGKAACLGIHPHDIELDGLELAFHRREPYAGVLAGSLLAYREKFLDRIKLNQGPPPADRNRE